MRETLPTADLSPQACQPASLDLELGRQLLHVTWSDGLKVSYPAGFLRNRCPCAACSVHRRRQAAALLPVLSRAQAAAVRAIGGYLVGNYALRIEWSDGHTSGIFDFRLLRSLAHECSPGTGRA
ncbi:MAG TPA: DUF971 domain-containing protein [Phycisphaerae bacterium]|nr:DUF971 domain-containing protein [Phycisphaerae bacterium]HRY68951.1 DUF971 domain-containing protein [Phycisphaerae bacterium]HSA25778.1 DUF971 domain-containing protein [Phycisphaerae bacterium]